MLDAWRQELPELAGPQLTLLKRAAKLQALVEETTRVELNELGLTYAEFDVLASLRRAGAPYRRRPSELTKTLMFTSGGISNVLGRLERAGLVLRESDDADARGRWVRLSDAGVELAEKALRTNKEATAELLADVPEETVEAASDILRDLLGAIRRRP